MANAFEDRRRLTFEQAEGVAQLPTQLRLKEISRELRARLWELFHRRVTHDGAARRDDASGTTMIPVNPWHSILYNEYVRRQFQPADEFEFYQRVHVTKNTILYGTYLEVFGLVQWVLRDPNCPAGLADQLADVLRESRAAYAVFDGSTIIPVGSDAEAKNLARAFADLAASEFHGARAHLREAGSQLTAGNYGPSIRDSIHAVEGVARVLEPRANTLPPALSKLEKSVRIHPALRVGFNNLYGFTNDEDGIRHALLDEPVAQVDEFDALYMLGSCAAFVSYLINKAQQAGLL